MHPRVERKPSARSRHVPQGTHSPLPPRASSTRPVPRASSRRRVEPRLHLDVPFLLVFDKIREVLGGGDVADVHAALQALDHEFVGLGAGAEDADEGRVGVFRVARLGGLPVADEIPRVAGLVLDVIQVVDGDAVLAALREVLIDIATDASLGETDEEGARADDDGAGSGALGGGEARPPPAGSKLRSRARRGGRTARRIGMGSRGARAARARGRGACTRAGRGRRRPRR